MTVNAIDAEVVLARMRELASRARGIETTPAQEPAAVDFGAVLKGALDHVSQAQHTATNLATRFERGEPGTDLGQVMVALQKANISFQAVSQVRNRLVSAYQEIMNMPI